MFLCEFCDISSRLRMYFFLEYVVRVCRAFVLFNFYCFFVLYNIVLCMGVYFMDIIVLFVCMDVVCVVFCVYVFIVFVEFVVLVFGFFLSVLCVDVLVECYCVVFDGVVCDCFDVRVMNVVIVVNVV